jgi:flagellar assembly protein FliH
MAATQPFVFETDFRGERPGRRASDQDVAAAREQAYAEGVAQGRAAARAEADAALTHMAGLIARQAEALLAAQDQRAAAMEAGFVSLAVMLARRLGGAALQDKPTALIEAAARECIAHARSAPHLAVRVHETLVETVERLFGRLTRESGYGGQVIILGEPDIAPGDARLEWADGGVVIDHDGLERALEQAVAQVLGDGIPTALR